MVTFLVVDQKLPASRNDTFFRNETKNMRGNRIEFLRKPIGVRGNTSRRTCILSQDKYAKEDYRTRIDMGFFRALLRPVFAQLFLIQRCFHFDSYPGSSVFAVNARRLQRIFR